MDNTANRATQHEQLDGAQVSPRPAHDFPIDFITAIDHAVMDRHGRAEQGEIRFRCPDDGHEDRCPSARWNRVKAAWRCDACGTSGGALDLADRLGIVKPARKRGGGRVAPPNITAPVQHSGCTLAQYAAAKRLPAEFLKSCGLSEISYQGQPAVRIPYRLLDGTDGPVQFRVAVERPAEGGDRFRWKAGSKAILYGTDRLDDARKRGYVIIVEGASDCHTLWFHDEPAIGLPGAGAWNETRDVHHLDGIATIYIVIEPDQSGEAVERWLASSAIRDRVRLVDLGPFKDPSGLYLDDPDRFRERWSQALERAMPWTEVVSKRAASEAAEAWLACGDLAKDPAILDRVADVIEALGVAGERQNARLLYLVLTSRFLDRPVSASIKGPSASGKSYLVEKVLELFPGGAYYTLTGMSERALAYGEEPLEHRYLVIYEAAGMSSDFASYLIRSLLSEGRIRYETVEKTSVGMRPRLIERAGPTGLLVTTTAVQLHPENETRLLSIPATDTREQTKRILRALATSRDIAIDVDEWTALQRWLAHGEHRVEVPYAATLADLVPPIAVRLRRDFGLLLSLIRTHAILHQASRQRDAGGRIIATIDDYAAVHELVADMLASGIEASVPPSVRATVTAVKGLVAPSTGSLTNRLPDDTTKTVNVAAIAKALDLDKSAASRRVKVATDAGYLVNLEDKRGKPARITTGDPLPVDQVLLPSPEHLRECCSDAVQSEGIHHPPPPVNVSDLNPLDRADVEELADGGKASAGTPGVAAERNGHAEVAILDSWGGGPVDGEAGDDRWTA